MSDVELVGHHDNGDAGVVELLENAHDFDGRFGVEVAGGLVGQEQLRAVNQGAGNGDALLLSARELVGQVVVAGGQTDDLEGMHGSLAHFFRGDAPRGVEHGQLDVFERGGAREQIEPLEDKTELLVAHVGELVAVQFGDVNAVE